MDSRIRHQARLVAVLLLPSLLACLGCGSPAIELTRVTGTVKLDGAPLAGARVSFTPESGRPSEGVTDDAGQFELRYTTDALGALPGKHRVSISTAIERDRDSSDPVVQQGRKESLPARYNVRSSLQEEVPASSETRIDFDLTSN